MQATIDRQAAELLSRKTEATAWEAQTAEHIAKTLDMQATIDKQAAELLNHRSEATVLEAQISELRASIPNF